MHWSTFGTGTVHAGEVALQIRPKFASNKMGVLFCHSSNGLATEALTYDGLTPIITALAGAGHPILSCELGGASLWANETSLDRVTEAKAYLQGAMGAPAGKVALLGLSMGGATALTWAGRNPTLAACVVGLIPAVDITEIVVNGRNGYVDAAYAGGWSEAVYGAAHNPLTLASSGAYANVPIRTYYGDADTICIPATQLAFGMASGATITPLVGGHASSTVAQVDPQEVVAFVAEHGGA